MKKILYFMTVLAMGLTFTACSDDKEEKDKEADFNIVSTNPVVDQDSYAANTTEANYGQKSFGNTAVDACATLCDELGKANTAIASAKLSETQEQYLREVLQNIVGNVIVPTYTSLADNVEDLEKTLNGLTAQTITQQQINKACDDFKAARLYWERSEAFLGGAASDFDT